MCDWPSESYPGRTNVLLEDDVTDLTSSPLERRYLRDYGETSWVILDYILEHNSKVTSKLDKALCDMQEAKGHIEKLKADMESFRTECDTIERGVESFRQEHDHLLEEIKVVKEKKEEPQRSMVRLHQGQPRYKTGDELDQLLARLCKINRGIFD